MKHSKFKKVLSLILTLVLIATTVPTVAMAAGEFSVPKGMYLISNTQSKIAPGVTENKLVTNKTDGQSQVTGYAVTVDMSEGSTASIMAGYADYDGTSWKLQSVRNQAAALEKKKNVNVVAGFNADIYNMQTGEPTNVLVLDGRVIKKGLGKPYFAVMNDGSVKIGSSMTESILKDVKDAVGGFYTLVENGKKTSYASYTGNFAPKTAVGIKADGDVVFYVADGRNAPVSVGLNDVDLADIMIGLDCVDVINLDGGGSTTYAAQYEGSDTLEIANRPSDGAERSVASSLFIVSSAKPTGEFDHASITPKDELYTPGSSIDFSALGVDSAGGKAELPADGKFVLDDSCASMGTITDDGKFVANDQTGTVKINYVSGEKVCGSTEIEIVVPDELYIPSDEVSLGFEETTDFGIVAKYKDRIINMKAGDIDWSIADEEGNDISGKAGTFNGLEFTTLDGVTINAVVTAKCKFNAELSVTIKAVIGALPVTLYDFEYTTDKAEAEADPDLEWIPSYQMPRFDRTTGTTSGYQAGEFHEQGYPLYCWPNQYLADQDSMKATVVSKDDGAPVRFGNKSLRIDYDYSSVTKGGNINNYLRVTDPDHAFEGSPTKIGAWVYVPEGTANFVLYLNCANQCDDPVNGYNLAYGAVTGSQGIDWTGWKYCEFDLTNSSNAGAGNQNAPFGFYQGCGVFWISYQPNGGSPKGDKTASTIYLDNIQLIYGADVDDKTNPIVKSINVGGVEIEDGKTVLDSNVNTFRASYADAEDKYATGIDYSEVRMLLDGVDVTDKCYINEGDEEIYFYDAELANGTHNIEISVKDKFGNETSESRYFTVKGSSASTQVNLVALDETPVLGEKYNLAIISDGVQNVSSADVSLKILSNFTKYWNKYEVVTGKGYALDGEATYDADKSTINFKVNKTSDECDDGIIAKIVFDIPVDVPEGLEVTYRIAKGSLTFVDAVGEKFVSSFSGKITTTCASPFILTTDTMVVGSEGGNIYVTDRDGNAVSDVNIYTSAGELIGVTDKDGKAFTDKFISSVMSFEIYAEKDGKLSFVLTSQSYPCGGDESGKPSYIKLNASAKPYSTKNISWMSSPLASEAKAVVEYAVKSDYEANGESAFKTFEGTSTLKEMNSTATIDTNYAVRINSAVLTGLKADAEYVYRVGDGKIMSDIKTFSTTRKGEAVNFFVIGDTQASDTTNTDKITENLASSGIDFSFGIQTGDAIDNGGNYDMWAKIADIFSSDYLGNIDMIHVLGNHEYYGDLNGSNASAYFNLPGTENETAPLCYSVQYGNVYVAVINYSSLSGYREAAKWLVEDANASTASWKILAMHQPPYFTNPSGTSESFTEIMAPAVDDAGIDIVFSGHDHSYARTEPMTGGEVDKENGAVYYICGSTGEKSYEAINNPDHHYAMMVGKKYNAIYLTVQATDKTLDITTREYTESGEDIIIDTYSASKEINCKDAGHDFTYNDGYLSCKVCGYSEPLGTYTGFAADESTGRTIYFVLGEARTGWQTIGDDAYYFDENGLAVTGKQSITHYDKDGNPFEAICEFDESGKQIGAAFVTDANGVTRAYRGGEVLKNWQEINGDLYYFSRSDGAMRTGKTTITLRTNQQLECVFSEDGKLIRGCLYKTEDGTLYYWGSEPVSGWEEIDGKTYYFMPDTHYMVTGDVTIDGVEYGFDSDGVLRHEGFHVYDPDWDVEIIKPNCTVDGKIMHVCKKCYTAYEETIPAKGHVDFDGDGKCDVCENSVNYDSPIDNFAYKLMSRIYAIYTAIMKILRNNYQYVINLIASLK
ncbi:MAG: phosphodiester glycosidase family protein [Acutalibacteraceae bacterium]